MLLRICESDFLIKKSVVPESAIVVALDADDVGGTDKVVSDCKLLCLFTLVISKTALPSPTSYFCELVLLPGEDMGENTSFCC
jgi:hypothetical protein